MLRPPHLTAEHWERIARGLIGGAATLPKTGNYEPYYNATNWDHDEVYAAARAEGRDTRSEVSQLVADKKSAGAWPRGRYKAKFWLQARWDMAGAYAMRLSEAARCLAIDPPDHAMDDREATKWLVWDAWDESLVDHWLAENLRHYAHYHHEDGIPESFVDYSNWLTRVESGHYIKK